MLTSNKLNPGKILEENKGLVFSIAGKYTGYGIPFEDLVQYGYLGFMKAINKFDESMGTKITTYAYPWIEGEIKHALRNNRLIHVPRRVLNNLKNIKEAKRELLNNGEEVTPENLERLTKIDAAEISVIIGTTQNVSSLNNRFEDGPEFIDFVNGCYPTPEEEYEMIVKRETLLDVINSTVFEEDREFVYLRFGFTGRVYTYKELGELYGKSDEWARQNEKRILRRIRDNSLVRQMMSKYEG